MDFPSAGKSVLDYVCQGCGTTLSGPQVTANRAAVQDCSGNVHTGPFAAITDRAQVHFGTRTAVED